ncbi:ankyrin repeat domain-containing protein [Gimesia sp.]|uniref:ankyrin repeat domain-containing protein n=1 Tax=Gimesia sp. TaxID=2024833 RepID=UPI0032EC9F43
MNENGNDLSQLIELVPPPQQLTEIEQPGQWDVIQSEMGIILPNDLRDFALTYGSGTFKDSSGIFSLRVFNPFARPFKRDVVEMQRILEYHGSPFDVFPSSPGLFTWGADESRRQFCWLTNGSPDSWPVIFITGDRKFVRYDTSLSGFLVQLFSGQVDEFGLELDSAWFQERSGEIFFKPRKPYDASKWPPLLEAILMLDQKKTRQLLNEGVDPNAVLPNGESPLIAAIETACDEELVKILLHAGADPNFEGPEGRTALQLAASSDYAPDCVEILLSAGAKVSCKDEDGWTPLLLASNRKFEDRVRILLAHGADPNDQLPNGKTALQLARQSKIICKMLKAAGATVES